MRTWFRRMVSVLCAAALAVCMVPALAFAEGNGPGASHESVPVADPALDTSSIETIELETAVQREARIQLFAATGGVSLKNGNFERWIDRVELHSFAKTLYSVLEEAADNDGYNDYLIKDAYFTGTLPSDGRYVRFANGPGYTGIFVASPTASCPVEQIKAEVAAVMAAFDRDHPEVFWLSGKMGMAVAEDTNDVYMLLSDGTNSMRDSAYASEYAIEQGIYERDTAARSILGQVPNGASQEDAVRWFNTWLTRNNEYNTTRDLWSLQHSYTAAWRCLSALTGRAGTQGPVCEGYARAFKVLCDYARIPCVLVDGMAVDPGSGRSEPHMWNYVQLAGKWYAADATWNDPAGRPGKISGGETDQWLLVGADTVVEGEKFLTTHPVENLVYENGICFTNGPVLNATAFSRGTTTAAVSISLPTAVAPRRIALTSVALSGSSFTFDGKVHKPSVTVKAGNATVASSNYLVSYSGDCKNVGTYTVTVTGIGLYGGTVKATFKIKQPTVKKPTLTAVSSTAKKRLAVTWKKASGKVTGYQVQCALNKKFTKSAKKVNLKLTSKLKKKAKLSKTVTKLKSKKTYYVRVRTYYKLAGKTFYSSWSKVKKVRVW